MTGSGIRGNHSFVSRLHVAMTCALLTLSSQALAQQPEIEIRGGAQPENTHSYVYVVTNRAASPIVSVDLPHFRGDVFSTPPGWTFEATERFTSLHTGRGRFVARAGDDRAALGRGQAGTFSVRISHLGAAKGRGEAVVVLADGRSLTIPVECAVPESLIQRYTSLVGMSAAFALFVLFGLWRSRRNRKSRMSPGSAGQP